ncbi:MAG: hypothetical protein IJ572_05565 [Bacilli bacterium]|nr:hypothetical protein [Bacilli bacterium]
MKKLKVGFILLIGMVLSGCSSKFEGTWCRFSDVPSSLVILTDEISEIDLNNITSYINTITDLKSYDIIDKIENASKMITIYYKSDNNINDYEKSIKSYSGVVSIKSTMMNEVVDKLIISDKNYVYDKSLNNLSATETKGTYKTEGDKLSLDNGVDFYYKDKFLCYDKDCTGLLTKANGSDCQ